jgi:hypothetical protein
MNDHKNFDLNSLKNRERDAAKNKKKKNKLIQSNAK